MFRCTELCACLTLLTPHSCHVWHCNLSQGFVSGVGRDLPGGGMHTIRNVIQTTAATGHQAGGVLVDSKVRRLQS